MGKHYAHNHRFELIKLQESPLEQGDYESCSFAQCDFSNASLFGFRFIDCVFEDCNFSLASLTDTAFREVKFLRCKMVGMQFESCQTFGLAMRFEYCKLDHASFTGLKLKQTHFLHSRLHEADFSEADLSGSVWEGSDLSGAVFDHTNLEKADFRGCEQIRLDPDSNRIKKARFSLSALPGLLVKYDLQIEG